MKAENTKLAESIKAVSDEMSIKTEIANKKLSDSITKQFREPNESLRKGFFSDLKAEIFNLTGTMNQVRKDTDLEVATLSHSVEAVREKLNEEVNEHKGVVQSQVEKVSQLMNKRTRDLDTELTGQITQTKMV
jgi:16S rRNA C967 or C1407 C5-methylase (RsmB/RsmF family)